MNWIIILVIIILLILVVIFHAAANEMRDYNDGINNAIDNDKRSTKRSGTNNRRDH